MIVKKRIDNNSFTLYNDGSFTTGVYEFVGTPKERQITLSAGEKVLIKSTEIGVEVIRGFIIEEELDKLERDEGEIERQLTSRTRVRIKNKKKGEE